MKGNFAFIAYLFVLIAGTFQANGELNPPSAFIKVGSERSEMGILVSYHLSSVGRTWNAANDDCKDTFKGNLVAITSKTVNNKVESIIDSNGLESIALWTDGRFDASGRSWLWWTTKAPLTSYTYRPPGVTDPTTVGGTVNSCMTTTRTGASFFWRTASCLTSFRYVCAYQD